MASAIIAQVLGKAARFAALMAAVFLTAYCGILLTAQGDGIAALWLANAVTLAFLLRSPRPVWAYVLATAFVANCAADVLAHHTPARAMTLSAINSLEVIIAAAILLGRKDRPIDITEPRTFRRFLVAAGIAPLISAALAVLYFALSAGGAASTAQTLLHWFAADSLGLLILVPLLLSIPRHKVSLRPTPKLAAILIAALVIEAIIFTQPTSLLFLTIPLLVFATFQLSLGATALVQALIGAVAVALTLQGLGPIAAAPLGASERMFVLQGYMVALILVTLPIAAIIQQRNQLGERLLRSERDGRRAAECLARSKSEFLATMSHEIRTPMTGVLGMIDLLAEADSVEEQAQYLVAMRRSADSLMGVLDAVLDFSKIEAGGISLNCREFDLVETVRQVAMVFQSAASRKGVVLNADIDPGASPLVVGDPLRFQQVLGNFISNAVKFTTAGRVDIVVRARPERTGQQTWTFAVSDTGVGIEPEEIDGLFEPFVQVGDRSAGGTGLGLAISRRIIEAMGGQAKVRSRKGHGSTFSFAVDLPIARPETAPVAASHATVAVPPIRSLSVLVAEDNAISQMLVGTLMRRMGHRVTCVDNGRRAAEAALAMPFDCILMDMQMPEVDGIQATRAIRESGGRNALIPIIALTADAVPERRRFYENIGLTAFITKPINRDKLDQIMADLAAAQPIAETRSAKAPALDLAQLDDLESVIGKDKLRVLLGMACDELRARPAAMRGMCDGGDLAALRQEAHSLKGAVSSLGLVAVARAAKAVELALPGAELEQSLNRLESEAERALLAVRALLAAPRTAVAANG